MDTVLGIVSPFVVQYCLSYTVKFEMLMLIHG